MQSQARHSEFQGWQQLVGRWATEATHPPLPGMVISGQATFEWFEDQRFLIQRSHYEYPEIPDAIAVSGIIDGKPSMHYFDPRGVHRVFAVDIMRTRPDQDYVDLQEDQAAATARSTLRPDEHCAATTSGQLSWP